jgi:D-alanyl-D-alanine carboxypeptidase/D-alanyl-D-alanine-endopeptidase (penicillin-binding protein 4)
MSIRSLSAPGVVRRLARPWAAAAALLLAAAVPPAGQAPRRPNVAPPPPRVTHRAQDAALAARIDSIVSRGPLARAHWGIEVRDAATGRALYRRDADRHFMPASNLKLVVAAAAARYLGPDFRYRTTVYGTGPVRDGVLHGDLVLYGRGDPTISGRYEARRTSIFEALADSLAARGVRRVAGAVVGDESHWEAEKLRGQWERYDLLWWYAAPVGALGFNDNCVDILAVPGAPGQPPRITAEPVSSFYTLDNRAVTVAAGRPQTMDFDRGGPGTFGHVRAYGEMPLGAAQRHESFAVEDPARYAATVFREVLAARGIAVDEPAVRVVSDPARSAAARATPLAEHLSQPLPKVLAPILLNSHNWFAEQLLKTLGREVRGSGSWDAGLALERDFLVREVGVDSAAFVLVDGSGLAAENLITPHAFVQVLDFVRRDPREAVVRRTLPVSGRAGSLQARLTDLPGRVAAKTGYISNVDSLSGYVTLADGREVIFSILVNGSGTPSTRVKAGIDDVVRAIAQYSG